MKKTAIWVLVALALAGACYAGYYWFWARSRPDAASYRTAPVKRMDVVSSIAATGTVVPEDVIDVGAQVNGQIAVFGKDRDGKTVDYRSSVDEGAVLARIDDALFAADVSSGEAQLAQAKAQVVVAQASRDQATARLSQAKRDWDRAQKLGESRALSQADYDASKSNYEQAVASLALAEASIIQAQAAVAIADASLLRSRRNLAYCTISSPVSGVIIDRRVEIGQTVVASLNAPSLFLIAKDLRHMQVLVQVNEADIGHVLPGEQVTFSADAFPGDTFKGEVRKVRLNATMTQNVVTYTVEIVTDNADLKLIPYLTANVRFETARRDQVLAVPSAALRWSPTDQSSSDAPQAPLGNGGQRQGGSGSPGSMGGQGGGGGGGGRPPGANGGGGKPKKPASSTLWVLNEAGLRPVTVKTGLSDGSVTEVESEDLKEGDLVVIGEFAGGAAASAANNPFAPPMFRGGRR